ncbi:bifunctional 5,10-methylenetetrahydrofolate dehydrogenase/5,10-methenyltetrahydrofolate cyclohydrolase [Alicyclobacillus dauci]|uniref:Bifunctional protein FolD n=1 Tax=Alicyclobacillus dauci TaxID=1475485 RepID=A0ABY6Z201_9BACL|nr:bifunctional 5,10-methylenetetrahydrofolate dehydrogenase/5,10-methenyltetrahydrofolate cyclohydrolase [Alicyclobacillus dauci]WAH36919.1 bifunctional 5,10-methylenetetrahydrofolate dehydrogenase/5,10-methenyltetrahydrofolate cyclohydrolase [Alicyclobacillus dauci]
MSIQLDGAPVAQTLRTDIRQAVSNWKSTGVQPKMVTLLVGDDKASELYAFQKARWAQRLGIEFDVDRLPADVDIADLQGRVANYSADSQVHGIMVELPLPDGIDKQAVVGHIHALKDVDGLSPCHSFAQASPDSALYPATPLACIRLLKHYGYTLQGADVTVVGCGQTVGLPLIHLLIAEGATVAACHEHTKDVRSHLRSSQIAFVAVGIPGLIKADMVHERLTVVDVGISETESGEVLGDLDAEATSHVQAFTPTPGGIGAVTTVQIFSNLMHAMNLQRQAGLI